jgi:Family of unknown function (DUF6885)
MASPQRFDIDVLSGTRALLDAQRRERPQRDDLCGAFCGSLALRAAGIERHGGEPIDQDAVARAAGTLVSAQPDPSHLPAGEIGRRDYRLSLPLIDDATLSGSAPAGVVAAIERLSGGALAALPFSGEWSRDSLGGLFDALGALRRPATLVASVATRELWGGAATALALLDYLSRGRDEGPAPDWDVGHFVCVTARVAGAGGSLYVVVDTYPALGREGIHAQPAERMVRALQRPGMAAGGAIAVVAAADAPQVRTRASALGLREGAWDNGTPAPKVAR